MMFKKILSTCQRSFLQLVSGFKRFPEPLAAAVLMVAVSIGMNHTERYGHTAFYDNLARLAMVFALGIPVYLILRLWFERKPNVSLGLKVALSLGVLGGLAAYYYFGLKTFDMVSLTRYSALTIASYLIAIIIPYYYKRENFELYCVRLLTNLTVTCFYALVLFLGAAATLFTIDKLFALGINGRPYFDLWVVVAGLFAPACFLAGFPTFDEKFQLDQYPKVIKILFLYIVIPLIVIYAAILYAYFAKIVISGSWPIGIVAHLVLWFGLICSSVFFFLYPLRPAVKWLDKLIKAFTIALFPLLAMLFVSMGIRVQAYGVTESRYFVLIAGLWIAGWMLYSVLAKKGNNLLLPLSVALIALLSVAGPLSAYSVSKFHQKQRFTAILKQYAMLRDHQIVKPQRPIAPKEQAKIVAILKYFQTSHSFRELGVLPAHFKLSQLPRVFGFQLKEEYLGHDTRSYFYYENQTGQLLNIKEYDYCYTVGDLIQNEGNPELAVEYQAQAQKVTIRLHGRPIYQQRVDRLLAPRFKDKEPPFKQAVNYLDQTKQVKVFYVFQSISGNRDQATEAIEFTRLVFSIYFKIDPNVEQVKLDVKPQ